MLADAGSKESMEKGIRVNPDLFRQLSGTFISGSLNKAKLEHQKEAVILLPGLSTDESSLRRLIDEQFRDISYEKDYYLYVLEADFMIRIPVLLSNVPTSFGGHFYCLRGENPVPVSLAEIDLIRQAYRSPDASSEGLQMGPESIDPAALEDGRKLFLKGHPELFTELNSWDSIEFLRKLGLLKNERLSLAAFLLFGKGQISDASGYEILWILKDDQGVTQSFRRFSPPFILNYKEALSSVKSSGDLPGYLRLQERSAEPEVLRELLINAIIYNDYGLSSQILIEETPSEISIINSCPSVFDAEKLAIEALPCQINNNALLVKTACRLGLASLMGNGFRRVYMQRKMNAAPMPDLSFSDAGKLRISVALGQIDKNYSEILFSKPQLGLHEAILLDRVQKNKHISEEDYRLLRAHGFVKGRYPDIRLSLKGEGTETPVPVKRTDYSLEELKDIVLATIREKGSLGRQDVDALLSDKFPKNLDETKKKNKIKNLLYQMSKKDFSIKNLGSSTKPVWALS